MILLYRYAYNALVLILILKYPHKEPKNESPWKTCIINWKLLDVRKSSQSLGWNNIIETTQLNDKSEPRGRWNWSKRPVYCFCSQTWILNLLKSGVILTTFVQR